MAMMMLVVKLSSTLSADDFENVNITRMKVVHMLAMLCNLSYNKNT